MGTDDLEKTFRNCRSKLIETNTTILIKERIGNAHVQHENKANYYATDYCLSKQLSI
jgi:hypothetical protein